jgi:spore germination protein GerM
MLRSHRSRARLVALSLLLAGCGLPQSSDFEEISGDDIQFQLDQTTTTSTSTIPPTTVDATSTTLADTTTSEIPTELVELYFVAGSQLNSVSRPLTRPVSPAQVLAALVAGPQGDIGIGLRTTIPPVAGGEITVVKDRGTAIIDLPPDIFDAVSSREQRLFFAQLVLTIGRLGGIGPVQFTLAGEPITAMIGDGTQAETVTIDDYQNLLVGAPPETSTATTTSTTTPEAPVGETVPGTTIGG